MTSSVQNVQPPVLNPSLGTPAGEWADKTASSFDQPSQGTPQDSTSKQATSQSPGVTPGNELPGAFPNRDEPETSTGTTNPTETSTGTTNITETIVGAARQYFPAGVVNTMQTYLGNNSGSTEAAGPGKEVRASEHDVLHKTSLPSQELGGALPHEHVGGAGSLPGASIEKSVAVLPDEQAEWSEWNTFAGRNTPGYHTPSNVQGKDIEGKDTERKDTEGKDTGPAQTVTQKATDLGVSTGVVKPDTTPEQTTEDIDKGYPETLTSGEIAGAQQAIGNIKPVNFDIKQAHDVSTPSTETQGQQPGEHISGAGSLPGSKDEQDVAVLPEERAIKTTETVPQEHHDELGAPPPKPEKSTSVSGVGVGGATDPLKRETQPKGTQRSLHSGEPTIRLEPRVYPLGGDASRWRGVNLGRRATDEWERAAALNNDLKSETVTSEPGAAGSEPGQPPTTLSESENIAGVQRSGGSEGSAEGQRKASLKEKISGGMKVVSGKLGHDKSKVEEGKKLMHGQSA